MAEPSALVGDDSTDAEYTVETGRPLHLYASQTSPMPETTLAAVLISANTFEVRELPIPDLAEDAALLKIEACGVCGSDARIRRRADDGPKIMGHENVGTIARIGSVAAQRWRLAEGDRVALEEYVTCGTCRWCRSEYFRYCSLTAGRGSAGTSLRYGSTPLSVAPGLWGGYSQYLFVHPGAVIHRLPRPSRRIWRPRSCRWPMGSSWPVATVEQAWAAPC